MSLVRLYKLYIKNTQPKVLVVEKTIFVCNLTHAVRQACEIISPKVHINTKILKHLYDRKPAEEFDFILRNTHSIVKYPDTIYKNKHSKKGEFCFVKKLGEHVYLCSVGKSGGISEEMNFIITCFRIRDGKYLNNYELLWSWKGGNPSS